MYIQFSWEKKIEQIVFNIVSHLILFEFIHNDVFSSLCVKQVSVWIVRSFSLFYFPSKLPKWLLDFCEIQIGIASPYLSLTSSNLKFWFGLNMWDFLCALKPFIESYVRFLNAMVTWVDLQESHLSLSTMTTNQILLSQIS